MVASAIYSTSYPYTPRARFRVKELCTNENINLQFRRTTRFLEKRDYRISGAYNAGVRETSKAVGVCDVEGPPRLVNDLAHATEIFLKL